MSEEHQIIEKKFDIDFNNSICIDFVIDSEDAALIFNKNDTIKVSLKTPTLLMDIVKFEEDKNKRLASFTLYENDLPDKNSWELIQKLEVDYCMVLILIEEHLKQSELDDWLEKCISLKELYNIESDGKMCLSSGFGPGIYKLLGSKIDNKIVGIKIEFIK
jgi:hypothetical protein